MPGTVETTRRTRSELRVATRRHGRLAVTGLSVGIADGGSYAVAVADNVSQGGLKLSGLSSRFQANKFFYRAVVSGGGKTFRLTMKPCWKRSGDGQSVEMGFKVIDAPWEWCEFTDPEIAQV
ncbi:MAG: hypothetical protein LBU39_10470 [Desulfobulbaceae bacterium]|jgi:hypothetical protein|nr:hypothetical protein [Desulfobulbaceae bacterium]